MTGGANNDNGWKYLSCIEQLVKGGTEWILTENSLPARMSALGTLSFNNQIFTTGKANIILCVDSEEILLFDPDTKTFNNIGKIFGEIFPSVSVVDINDFICSNADTKPFAIWLSSVFLILIYLSWFYETWNQ